MNLVYFNIFNLVSLLCLVVEIQCEGTQNRVCYGCQPTEGYARNKRAKYYSGPPPRFYQRPPASYPFRGPFPYAPPPAYTVSDDETYQANYGPKFSKRPTYDGLGDEEINNIVKHLSKQDLDKIIEFSNEREKESLINGREFGRFNHISSRPDIKSYESNVAPIDIENDQKFSLSGPYVKSNEGFRPYVNDYGNQYENNFQETAPPRYPDEENAALFVNTNKFNSHLDSEESMHSHQFSYPSNKYQEVKVNFNTSDDSIYTDSSVMQEEELPKPSNLREDDFEGSYTNNVPTIIRADSDSYKIENFGTLPLMNYHSKLDTVDSYRVPHYTVTSPVKHGAPTPSANIKAPPVEPAPPASAGSDQSDAHLKALKIWTHMSKGTAYTLHDDGSLSLERPLPPKTNYGHP